MRCYEIWFSSLVGSNHDRRMVGLDDLVGPFQPCDSMLITVLCFTVGSLWVLQQSVIHFLC